MSQQIVVTGSLAFDHIMNLPGVFADFIMPDKIHRLNISFTVDTFRREYGGTGANISYNLALLGLKPVLLTAAGKDWAGYRRHLEQAGVDVSRVKVDNNQATASGFVVTDQHDNQIWSFFPGPLERVGEIKLKDIKADFYALLPISLRALSGYLRQAMEGNLRFMFDPAIYIPSLASADLRQGLRQAEVIIGNDYEIELWGRRLGKKLEKLVGKNQVLITTLAHQGSIIQQGGKKWQIPAAKVENTSDPTGAGDAYRAGFLAGYLKGLAVEVCGRMGSVCAAYTVEKYGTQTHKFNLSQFKKRYKENFKHELDL